MTDGDRPYDKRRDGQRRNRSEDQNLRFVEDALCTWIEHARNDHGCGDAGRERSAGGKVGEPIVRRRFEEWVSGNDAYGNAGRKRAIGSLHTRY